MEVVFRLWALIVPLTFIIHQVTASGVDKCNLTNCQDVIEQIEQLKETKTILRKVLDALIKSESFSRVQDELKQDTTVAAYLDNENILGGDEVEGEKEALNLTSSNDENLTSAQSSERERSFSSEHVGTQRTHAVTSSTGPFASEIYVNKAISTLNNEIKCSLAQRKDTGNSGFMGLLNNANVTLNEHRELKFEFQLESCADQLTTVWLNISEKQEERCSSDLPCAQYYIRTDKNVITTIRSITVLQIPIVCLTISQENVYSFDFSSTNSHPECQFLRPVLHQCKMYIVEIMPVYGELQGKSSAVQLTVLPSHKNSGIESFAVYVSENIVDATWSVNSAECAKRLTSIELKVTKNVLSPEENQISHSYSLSHYCFYDSAEQTEFQTTFNSCLEEMWEPIEKCHMYRFEAVPKFFGTLEGTPSIVEVYSSNAGDGESNPGQSCDIIKNEAGTIKKLYPLGYRRHSWLILVEQYQQIWLTAASYLEGKMLYCDRGNLKVYDGPSESSHLLFDFCESRENPTALVRKFPVRSNNNTILILLEWNSGHAWHQLDFHAEYQAVNRSNNPFVPGCGGFIVDKGIIELDTSVHNGCTEDDQLFYIRTSNPSDTLLLTNKVDYKRKSNYSIIVYGGWAENDPVIYNNSISTEIGVSRKLVAVSLNDKLLVKFSVSNNDEVIGDVFKWDISKLNSTGCNYEMTEESGAIESPNFPDVYPSLTDCQWTIRTEPNTRIRFTFLGFRPAHENDGIIFYDGHSVNAPVIKQISGTFFNTVTVTSSSNSLVVRFFSNSRHTDEDYDEYYSDPRLSRRFKRYGFSGVYTVI